MHFYAIIMLYSAVLPGNNAVEMETTAVYDKNSSEWIVNSPTTLSQKYWITNGAVHAKHCVVFARYVVRMYLHIAKHCVELSKGMCKLSLVFDGYVHI